MSFNEKNIHDRYNRLAEGTYESWEVYTGETAGAMAQEEGIPPQKWLADTGAMAAGQQIMQEALAQEPPKDQAELESRLRSLIRQIVSSQLRTLPSDMAKKGLLVQALATSGYAEEAELPRLARMELDTLQKKLEDAAYSQTVQVVLPALKQQIQLLAQDEKQAEKILENAGALGAAAYLNDPQLQENPEVVGASAELATHYAGQTIDDDILLKIACGLFMIAVIIATLSLLAAGAAHLLVEGTFAGIGAAIAKEIALFSGMAVGMLKAALGSAVLGAIFAALQLVTDWDSGNYPVRHDNPVNPHVKV